MSYKNTREEIFNLLINNKNYKCNRMQLLIKFLSAIRTYIWKNNQKSRIIFHYHIGRIKFNQCWHEKTNNTSHILFFHIFVSLCNLNESYMRLKNKQNTNSLLTLHFYTLFIYDAYAVTYVCILYQIVSYIKINKKKRLKLSSQQMWTTPLMRSNCGI